MKFLAILITIGIQASAQDKDLFDYVNVYRDANDAASLVWDQELYTISKQNTIAMVGADSLMHSGTNTYECSHRDFSLVPTQAINDDFNSFLGKYYDRTYSLPKTNEDVIDYILLYTVYKWHKSPEHRKVMLSDDAVVGSVHIDIKDIKFKPNYKMIGGKKIEFSKFISHYEAKFFATLNLNI